MMVVQSYDILRNPIMIACGFAVARFDQLATLVLVTNKGQDDGVRIGSKMSIVSGRRVVVDNSATPQSTQPSLTTHALVPINPGATSLQFSYSTR
jgi:hypothetical protein